MAVEAEEETKEEVAEEKAEEEGEAGVMGPRTTLGVALEKNCEEIVATVAVVGKCTATIVLMTEEIASKIHMISILTYLKHS